MKRSKLLLVLVFALVAVMALVACDKTPVHEHSYGGWTITAEPTETTEGTATRSCACGEKETATLAKLSDTNVWTISKNVPATHTQDGCVVYTSQYGTVITTLTKLTDHKYGAWTITEEPDLIKGGRATRTCECGYVDTATLPNLEDASVWTASTVVRTSHDVDGIVKYTSVYGTVETTVAKGEHSWSSWTIIDVPTATEVGKAVRFCTTDNCKASDEAVLPVLDDATFWTKSVTPATCTNAEVTSYTSTYGVVSVETAEAKGHNVKVTAILTEPTCTEKGSATVKCADCDYEATKEIAALGHDYEHGTWVINTVITGEEDTKHIKKCARCDEVSTSHRENHNFGEPEYKVSESAPGYHSVIAVYTCSANCGYTKTEELTGYLEQTEFWTKGEEIVADYNHEGSVTYTYKKANTEITITTPKKVAPYDGKTYYSLAFTGNSNGRVLTPIDSWAKAKVVLDENGRGTGSAYPFRGDISVTMVDEATGKISMKVGSSSFDGYVDFESGIIVRARYSAFDDIFMMIPETMGITKNDVKASAFADVIAIKYASLCNFEVAHSFNLFVNGKGVTFNTTFVDKDGNNVSAENCYNSDYVKVLDKDGNRVASYAKNAAGKLEATDGYEGAYTDGAGETVVIDGLGKLVITNAEGTFNGTYAKAADADYFEVYVVNESGVKVAYYQVTFDGNTYTKVQPMTAVHFVTKNGEAPDITEFNTNIAQTLPVLVDTDTEVFRGWKIAEDGEAVYTYTPDGNEVTFTAVWETKVIVMLAGVKDGDPTTVAMGVNDNIISKLPAYVSYETLSADGKKFFLMWKVGDIVIEEETLADAELNGMTITAVWQNIPAYVGTYKGANTYGNGFINSKDDVTIDLRGNISGRFSGTITEYDASEQLITFTYNNSTYYLRFDEGSGVLIGGDGTTSCKFTLGGDFDTYGIEKPTKYYRLYAGATSNDALVRFITIKTKYADNDDILFYNDRIYSNISITDALGNVLTTETIKNAKTLVVTDLSTGKIIFKAASTGTKFGDNNYSQDLDEMFGTYTCEGKNNMMLDGIGGFKWGDKVGTYAVKDATAKTYDAYVLIDGVKTEYYVFTIDTESKTFAVDMPSVAVSLVSDHGTVESPVQANLNVAFKFPEPTEDGMILKGWYLQGDETKTIVKEYVPKADDNCTFVALWAEKVTLSIVYGNGVENKDVEFGKGDALDMTKFVPEYTNGKVFDHWYLSDDNGATEKAVFAETTINANTTVYCAWIDKQYSMKDSSKNAKYKFTYKDGVWTSGNKYQDNTISSFTITALGDITVSFSYKCSSESWDKLTIKYGTQSISKSAMSSFADFECTLSAGQTIEITYKKDSSDYDDEDAVFIKNLKVNGTLVEKYDD